jgi:hypothetical protein
MTRKVFEKVAKGFEVADGEVAEEVTVNRHRQNGTGGVDVEVNSEKLFSQTPFSRPVRCRCGKQERPESRWLSGRQI